MGPRSATGNSPHHQPGKYVDDDSHEEKRESDFHERAEVEVVRRLSEFVRDYASHGVARSKQ